MSSNVNYVIAASRLVEMVEKGETSPDSVVWYLRLLMECYRRTHSTQYPPIEIRNRDLEALWDADARAVSYRLSALHNHGLIRHEQMGSYTWRIVFLVKHELRHVEGLKPGVPKAPRRAETAAEYLPAAARTGAQTGDCCSQRGLTAAGDDPPGRLYEVQAQPEERRAGPARVNASAPGIYSAPVRRGAFTKANPAVIKAMPVPPAVFFKSEMLVAAPGPRPYQRSVRGGAAFARPVVVADDAPRRATASELERPAVAVADAFRSEPTRSNAPAAQPRNPIAVSASEPRGQAARLAGAENADFKLVSSQPRSSFAAHEPRKQAACLHINEEEEVIHKTLSGISNCPAESR